MNFTSKTALWIEWSVLFIGFPLLAWSEWIRTSKFFIFALPVIYALVAWRRGLGKTHHSHPVRPYPWKNMIVRIVIALLSIFLLALWLVPDRLFEFPRAVPGRWALVMFFYPLLSALPQEFLYRQFFFARYQRLFPTPALMIASSTVTFGFLHLMYDNLPAIALTLVGGFIFSMSYSASGRLIVPWIEHALYGMAAFTVGLGIYFYEPIPR
jgi:membrane protease YdiL (CAAX protease family)